MSILSEEEKKAIENIKNNYNEILKEFGKNAINNASCYLNSDINILLNLIEKLQSKIDKAIEYIGIDEELEKCCNMYDVNGIDLLRILKGD